MRLLNHKNKIEKDEKTKCYMKMTDGVTGHDYERELNKYIDYLEKENKQLNLACVNGWLDFTPETMPVVNQEILIVWETYPPEKRKLKESDLKMNWDGMRWMPIPAYR